MGEGQGGARGDFDVGSEPSSRERQQVNNSKQDNCAIKTMLVPNYV